LKKIKHKREKRLVRPGQLLGNSERPCGIFFSLLKKYETIVSRNGLSLGYLEQDTSSVMDYVKHGKIQGQ
jgi:hypothetical protein